VNALSVTVNGPLHYAYRIRRTGLVLFLLRYVFHFVAHPFAPCVTRHTMLTLRPARALCPMLLLPLMRFPLCLPYSLQPYAQFLLRI
jgi:hypothetical protein